MKTVKGSGLFASVLTFLHGGYMAFYLLWFFVLILLKLWSTTTPSWNFLALALLDTVVYLFLGVGMLRDRRTYFVYAVLWTVWGALLATFAVTYKDTLLNLLSFLIVFSSTYYHVSVNRTNSDVAKALGRIAGALALIQGVIVTFAFTLTYILHLRAWIILAPPFAQLLILEPTFMLAAAWTAIVNVVLGVGMLKGRKEFFFIAIFWTIAESALAVADSSYTRTHFNFISMLILAFGTYYYVAKTKTR